MQLAFPGKSEIKVAHGGTKLSLHKNLLFQKKKGQGQDSLGGFISFLGALIVKEDKNQDTYIQQQKRKKKYLTEDIAFFNERNAAYLRQPKHRAILVSSLIAAVFFLCCTISFMIDVPEVTHAEGAIVGAQRTQVIQNFEGGILRSLFVHEGQIVDKDMVLAQLDNEIAESSYRDTVNRTIENTLALERLESEKTDKSPNFPSDLDAWLAKLLGHTADERTVRYAQQVVVDQTNTWKNRVEQLRAEIDVLQSQFNQHLHEMNEEVSKKAQLDRSLLLAIKQRDTAHALVKHNNFSRIEYIGLEQRVVDLQGQVHQLEISIPKAKAAIEEYRRRIVSRRAEEKAAISQEINKLRVELTGYKEILTAGRDRVTRTELRSPVRGTVKQIYITTLGGVVKSGDPIMDIVPLDNTLLIEARVLPKDVAFLHPGQSVVIKISAYEYHIYGGLEGTVESISSDTVEDRMGNYFYIVKVRTPMTTLKYGNTELPLIPGMIVTADIHIGHKKLFDYIMKPILKTRQNFLEFKYKTEDK